MAETPKDVFLKSLLLDGSDGLKAQIAENLLSAVLKRTTDGAPTLELEVWDKNGVLRKSNIINSRITAQLQLLPTDKIRSFELADIKKNDENLTLVLEDLAVAEMRRHDLPRKFAAGSVTRVQAAKTLLDEIGWIPMVVGANTAQAVKVELARGQLTAVPKESGTATVSVDESYFDGGGASAGSTTTKQTEIKDENREDTWTAIKRWFSEINWTCYVDDGVLNVGPDSAYISGDPAFRVTDGLPSLTSYVNYDWDVGKPVATGEYSVVTDTYAAAPGTCIELYDLGPADGKWFIAESTRNLFTVVTDISIKTPTPELPEPEATASASGSGAIDDGYFNSGAVDALIQKFQDAITGTGAAAGDPKITKWVWPTTGSHHINSDFGPRIAPGPNASSYHRGIDIQAELNQSVLAARDGIVTYAGPMSGYGNVVIMDHSEYISGSGVQTVAQTRYGHLNVVSVRRGLVLTAGQLVGLAGRTGNATGVCIHFEIRKGAEPFPDSTAVDPYFILVRGE